MTKIKGMSMFIHEYYFLELCIFYISMILKEMHTFIVGDSGFNGGLKLNM